MFKDLISQIKLCNSLSKGQLITWTLFGIFDKIPSIFNIIYLKFIIDIITIDKDIKKLIYYVIIYVLIQFILNFTFQVFVHISNTKQQEFWKNTHMKIVTELTKVDYEVLEQDKYLKKLELADQFVSNVKFFQVGFAIANILSLISIIAIISTLNIWLVIFLILMIAINTFAKNKFGKKEYELNKCVEKNRRKINYLNKILKEKEFGKEIRINSLKDYFLNEYKLNRKEIFKSNQKKRLFNNFYLPELNSFTDFLRDGLAYIYVTISVLVGNITLGSFTMYIQAISTFSSNILETMRFLVEIKNSNFYYDDFKAIYDFPKEMQKGQKIIKNPNESYLIEFKNVSFKYPNNKEYILKDINIKIEKGEKLAIVGENGAGKSTFIKLLIRLYDVTEGEILIDGVNIKEINYKNYMECLSVVFQDFKLFYESIKENVALSKVDETTDEEILSILEKSGLKENMKKFKKGIHTTVYKEFDDEGVELSGGESQKLCIARALFKNSGIVILDEPTAALDPRSEYEIYTRFDEIVENKTSIYISHRLSSTRFCDKIAVFENGKIIEYGTHNELMENNGIYNELYNKQAEFYK